MSPLQRHCVGCMTPIERPKVACRSCWLRLPIGMRKRIQSTDHGVFLPAMGEMVAWFRENRPAATNG